MSHSQKEMYSYHSQSLNDSARRTYDIVMTYERNHTINMTLIGNKYGYTLLRYKKEKKMKPVVAISWDTLFS